MHDAMIGITHDVLTGLWLAVLIACLVMLAVNHYRQRSISLVIDDMHERSMAMASGEYLIWSNEHGAWWRSGSQGYTTSLQQAGRYSREDAIVKCCGHGRGKDKGGAPYEIPVRAADMELVEWD
jgi:hypothetical protein